MSRTLLNSFTSCNTSDIHRFEIEIFEGKVTDCSGQSEITKWGLLAALEKSLNCKTFYISNSCHILRFYQWCLNFSFLWCKRGFLIDHLRISGADWRKNIELRVNCHSKSKRCKLTQEAWIYQTPLMPVKCVRGSIARFWPEKKARLQGF